MSAGLEYLVKTLESINDNATFFDWVRSFPIRLKDGFFSFEFHPELEFLYRDEHANKVIRKSVQCGASTWAILFTLFRALKKKSRCIYYGPTDNWIRSFIPTRFDSIMNQIPELQGQKLNVNEKQLKDFGDVSIHLLGLESKGNVASIDADTTVVDEASIVNPERLEESRDRTEHSREPMMVQLSKPELPGCGIDAAFGESDQHFFLMKCPKCGHYNNVVMQFPDCIVPHKGGKTAYLGCSKCSGELDPRTGKWAPLYPGRDVRGIQLSQLYWVKHPNPKIINPATDIWLSLQKADSSKKKKRIYRSKAGLPWADADMQLTDQLLKELQGVHGLSRYWTGTSYLGYDQGDEIHLMSGHLENSCLYIHWAEVTEKFERLDAIMMEQNVWAGVGDMKPNTHNAKKWALNHPGKAWVQDFIEGDSREGKAEKDGKEVPKISLNREECLDELIEMLLDGRIILPRCASGEIMLKVWEQLKNLRKETVTTSRGEKKRYMNNNNHFGMALLNCYIATKLSPAIAYGLPIYAAGASFNFPGKGGMYDH